MNRLLSLSLVVLASLASCATPLVQRVRFEGTGEIRSDGDAFVGVGNFMALSDTWLKGGYPGLPIPLVVGPGQILYFRLSTGERGTAPSSAELPSWAQPLMQPGESIPPLQK